MKIDDLKFIVYCHIFPNGKRYVGITSQSLNCRFRKNGEGYKGQMVYNAIQKYGWHNIEHRILYENLPKEDAEQKEIEIIKEWKTNNRKFGYNRASGGGVNIPDELSKQKNRLAHLGKNKGSDNPFWNKHHTKETKDKLGKYVICVDTGEKFTTIKNAAQHYNIQSANIWKCCKGLRHTAGGLRWKYECE